MTAKPQTTEMLERILVNQIFIMTAIQDLKNEGCPEYAAKRLDKAIEESHKKLMEMSDVK